MAIDYLLNSECEEECVQDFILEEALFEDASDDPDDLLVTENDQDVGTALHTQEEQLKVLTPAKLILSL